MQPAASSKAPVRMQKVYKREARLLNIMVQAAIDQKLAGAIAGREAGATLKDIAEILAKCDEIQGMNVTAPSAATCDKWLKDAVAERRKTRPTVLARPMRASPDHRVRQH